MTRVTLIVSCFLLLASTAEAQRSFVSKNHRIAALLPGGWDEVQGIRDNTVLKLARSRGTQNKARITVVLDDIPKGRVADSYDIWTMSDDDIRRAVERGSIVGETVTVLDVGRSTIDGVHVVWNKN